MQYSCDFLWDTAIKNLQTFYRKIIWSIYTEILSFIYYISTGVSSFWSQRARKIIEKISEDTE